MKYGFIGCGNMGGALARALSVNVKDVMLADYYPEKAQELACELGVSAAKSNLEIIKECEGIFLAVKPQMMEKVLEPLQAEIQAKKPLLITIAAGIEIKRIEELAGGSVPVIRLMPNTPVAVGKGLIMYCANEAGEKYVNGFVCDMRASGTLDRVDEKLIDAGTALSGCGPAYMYMLIEALADGAVACGLPRDKALLYAAKTMEGASTLLLETGKHPGKLKDEVCSPGGSTIAGVKALEDGGFRSSAINAVVSAYKRNKELGK